ncbi:hypothetical protein ENU1_193610 [Entamoeba nuttalli P19]|uniref:Uncharacterized protein n=1 Tax=Entamoeba nuttalli (strain P19) TaxID=1076696 RepID=K2GRF1_ENTNP|nr:hypothetical protein ENU1_193610 [Entamoeba nuttalli P19]EKE37538.1 hypothetical protein ENU1_193610 [Entamoeba nuttalli P19]|eukprot:XP_008860127.1 hypothetical protein ENU1_193610 [Entamoeba nuttalli P19]
MLAFILFIVISSATESILNKEQRGKEVQKNKIYSIDNKRMYNIYTVHFNSDNVQSERRMKQDTTGTSTTGTSTTESTTGTSTTGTSTTGTSTTESTTTEKENDNKNNQEDGLNIPSNLNLAPSTFVVLSIVFALIFF